jgi:sialidase-1
MQNGASTGAGGGRNVEVSRRSFLTAIGATAVLGPAAVDALAPGAALADSTLATGKMLFGDAAAGALAVRHPSGIGSYHSFRIPALVAMRDPVAGTTILVAAAEGRPDGVDDDSGNFDLLFRRSADGGTTWSRPERLAGGRGFSWTNPTLVYDAIRNELHCLMVRRGAAAIQPLEDDPRVFTTTSTDRGITWSTPVKQPQLDRRGAGADCVGPGNGIQRASGTLVVPARGRLLLKAPGRGWVQSEPLPYALAGGQVPYSEGTVVERTDGQLILNYRASGIERVDAVNGLNTRRILVGEPGAWQRGSDGEYWRRQIVDPISEASQIIHIVAGAPALVHLNSASVAHRHAMKVRASLDSGESWTYSRVLSDAPLVGEGSKRGRVREGGYSSLASTGTGTVYALVEARRAATDRATELELSTSRCSVVFRRIDPKWIVSAA